MNTAVANESGDRLPRVAVVVPIYNVDQYLEECLASIASQTILSDMDIVLVDDGSDDRSPEIAAAFASRHDNVTLIRQENGGPGKARNRGLQEVTAPFVAFCDSDDILPADAYETLRTTLLASDSDVAIGDMEMFPKERNYPWRHCLSEATVVEGIEAAEDLIHSAGPCNKLFRTEMLREIGASFREQGYFEDVYLVLPALLLARRIALTSKVVYRYRQRAEGGSIKDSFFIRPENFWDHLAVEEFLAELRPTLPGLRRRALDIFLVRSFQGFALRAPRVMGEVQLRRYFDRAVQVYRGMAPDLVRAGCRDTRHRVAMVSLLLSDWALFADSESAILGLEARDGRLHLKLGRELPDLIQALLAVDRMTAHLEAVDCDVRKDELRLTGRFDIDGLALSAPLQCGLAVRIRGSAVTQQAKNISQEIVVDGASSVRWSGFTCDIPASSLRHGDHQVRLVVDTPTGQVSAYMRLTSGMLGPARTLLFSSCRADVLEQEGAATIRVVALTETEAVHPWPQRPGFDDGEHPRIERLPWRTRLGSRSIRSLRRSTGTPAS